MSQKLFLYYLPRIPLVNVYQAMWYLSMPTLYSRPAAPRADNIEIVDMAHPFVYAAQTHYGAVIRDIRWSNNYQWLDRVIDSTDASIAIGSYSITEINGLKKRYPDIAQTITLGWTESAYEYMLEFLSCCHIFRIKNGSVIPNLADLEIAQSSREAQLRYYCQAFDTAELLPKEFLESADHFFNLRHTAELPAIAESLSREFGCSIAKQAQTLHQQWQKNVEDFCKL